jgi:hypothetical protein
VVQLSQRIIADELTVFAQGPMELVTAVNFLVVDNNEALTLIEADAIVMNTNVASLALVTESAGGVSITEFDDLTLAGIEIATGVLTVQADSLNITGRVSAQDIVLSARTAGITMAEVALLVAGSLDATAVSGIDVKTEVAEVRANVTGAGDLRILEVDAVVMTDLSTAGGSIFVRSEGAGNIQAVQVASLSDADDNDITLVAAEGAIEAGYIVAGSAGDVTLSAGGDITDGKGKIVADELSAQAGGAMVLDTTVTRIVAINRNDLVLTETDGVTMDSEISRLVLTTESTGDVVVAEVNGITVGDVSVADGALAISAEYLTIEGTITAASISLASVNDIAASGTPLIVTGFLAATAVTGIDLVTTVDEISAEVTGTGDIVIRESDAVVLQEVSMADGSIAVNAGGTITAISLISQTDSDDNDISLTTAGDIAVGIISAGSEGDVILSAAGAVSDIATMITADELIVTAAGPITLVTTVNLLTAASSGSGDVTVTETDAITLANVTTADGSITVNAGGTITALYVESRMDAAGKNISLAATGDILISLVRAGRTSGKINLVASGDIREVANFDSDVDLSGRYARVEVGGEFGSATDPNLELELDLGTLEFNGPYLILDHQGDIELIATVTGIIDVSATETITATHLVSGQGKITLIAGEDILIGYVDAGAQDGVVNLTAVGSIYELEPADEDVDLIAQEAYLFAGAHIRGGSDENLYLETKVGTLVAEVGSSTIYINELDNIELVSLIAPEGEIGIVAGGDILITGVVTTGSIAGTVFMQAGGWIYMEGDVPVTTAVLQAVANSGIFLRTGVATLDAKVQGQGILEIRETDSIVLRDVTNANGPIRVIAGGSVTAIRVESLADEKGNNVGLMTLSGDIVVDYVGAGTQHGQISLSSAGNISEAADHDKDADLRGALGILYAQGKIDRGLDRSFKPIHHCGWKSALYEFERGEKLNLVYVEGDVELFFSLKNKVHVFATGTIRVTYLDSHGKDVYLRSKYEDITIEYLDSGPSKGDIELHADDSVYLAGRLYNGGTGQIIAGDDLWIRAGDDIRLFGNVSAGGDINLCADHSVEIAGTIAAGDDIEIWADDGIYLDAPMTAGDRIELGTCGYLETTVNAPLTAGGDIDLYAKGSVTVGGEVIAGEDVWVRSECGDVLIDGRIVAGDGIDVWAGKNLIISAPLQAGDDLDLYAKGALKTVNELATLTAGMDVVLGTCKGDIELFGAVTAGAGWAPCSSKHWCCWHQEKPDVVISSGGAIRLHGAVTAQDDVTLSAWGDISVSGTIAAGDEIRLTSWDDLSLLPGSLLTGLSGKKAQRVSLFARDQVTLQGAINAEKLIVIPKARCSMLFPGEAGCFRC